MADTPESLVYRGREGTGAAQIFGREGNPLRAYHMRKGDIEQKEAVRAAQAKLDKEKRDKKMWDLINVNPEKAFQPFNQQVIDAADKHRAKIVSYFEAGGNPDDADFLRQTKKGWEEVNDLATRANYIKSTIDDTQKLLKENPNMKVEYYYPKIWDLYMDEKGNGKPLDQIDPVAIQNIYLNDPMGFDANKYTKDFTSNMKDNVFNFVKQRDVYNGIMTEDIESKVKGQLYTIDPKTGDPVKDAKGNPIINLTPDFLAAFTDNENAKRFFEAKAAKEGVDVNQVIESFVRPQTGVSKDIKASFSRTPIGNQNRADADEKFEAAVTDRDRKIVTTINGITSDGKITPEAQAAVGALRNAKYLDGNVVDVELIPGTSTPGKINFHGQQISTSPSNRLVFSVKTSDRGTPKIHEANLNSPESYEMLNGLFNNSPSENPKNKFSTNDITRITGRNLTELYGSTNNDAQAKADAARIENDTVERVMAAPEDADIPDLEGKTYNGQKIISAKKVVTDSGYGIGKFRVGKETAIEIELPDDKNGNKQYKTITDKEEIRKIIKGQGDDMVTVIAPNGQRGKMSKAQYEQALKDGVQFKLAK